MLNRHPVHGHRGVPWRWRLVWRASCTSVMPRGHHAISDSIQVGQRGRHYGRLRLQLQVLQQPFQLRILPAVQLPLQQKEPI